MKKQTDETPDVTIARLIEKALICDDPDNRRADALPVIEHLINGADRLARKVMDEDETNTFCVHLDSALAILDDMD
jgi:hypothetical protein